jgi:hypothetical protein
MGDTCVDDVPRLGITLPHLLALVEKIEALARADDDGAGDAASPPLLGLTTAEVNSRYIVRLTSGTQESYCFQHREEEREGILPATVFVSHAWGMPFLTLISSLKAWHARYEVEAAAAAAAAAAAEEVAGRGTGTAAAGGAAASSSAATSPASPSPSPVVFWLDLVSNNQHKTSDRPFTWWTTCFRDNIGRLGRVLLVLEWGTPRPLKRAWCLWEIASAASTGAALEFLLSPEEEGSFASALEADMPRMLEVLTDIDVAKAEAYLPRDRDMILHAAEETAGLERLNSLIISRMRRWMLEAGTAQLALIPDATRRRASGLQHALADLHCELGERGEALRMFEEAVAARTDVHGPEGPETLKSATMLAWMHGIYHGRLEEGLELSARALAGTAAALGPRHPDALVALNQHAILLKRANRLDEAEAASAEALAGRLAVFGETGTPTLKSFTSHANLLTSLGRHGEALALFRRGLEGKQAALGEPHPSTLSSLRMLAAALVAAADAGGDGAVDTAAAARAEAAALLEQALPLMRRVLGKVHPETLSAEKQLAAAACRP